MTTKRAYTMRLGSYKKALDSAAQQQEEKLGRPLSSKEKKQAFGNSLPLIKDQDALWQALWLTHEAVNQGAHKFGDTLLTLRAGIGPHHADKKAADAISSQQTDATDLLAADKKQATADAISAEQQAKQREKEVKQRRILLVFSWLSVESKAGAPAEHIVYPLDEAQSRTQEQILHAVLDEILRGKGMSDAEQRESWLQDCGPSLQSPIREDAVWVNRAAAFQKMQQESAAGLGEAEIWDLLQGVFGSVEAYLKPVKLDDDDDAPSGAGGDEKDFVQKAGSWLSQRFGTGGGADFSALVEGYVALAQVIDKSRAIWPVGRSGRAVIGWLAERVISEGGQKLPSQDLDGLLKLFSGPGYKSATRNLLQKLDKQGEIDSADLDQLYEKAQEDAASCRNKDGVKGQRPYADALLRRVELACRFGYLGEDKKASSHHKQYAVMLDHAMRRVSLCHTWLKRREAERQLLVDKMEDDDKPEPLAKQWLDDYCQRRGERSGSDGKYRIRRRAISGWDEVCRHWLRPGKDSLEARQQVIHELQEELEKFGDARLFEDLAAERPIWQHGPALLGSYVARQEADFQRRHYKVPAYCHPDALRHPIFCDFGNSRWHIDYAAQGKKQGSAVSKRGLRMMLWDGQGMREHLLCWHAKRLAKDLMHAPQEDAIVVSRADRLGRAAAGAGDTMAVQVAVLFDKKHWNGRLQVPRAQLNALARIRDKQDMTEEERQQKMAKMRTRLHWLLSFSADLESGRGAWSRYCREKLNMERPMLPHAEQNKKRGSRVRLRFSRAPGLRVLGVDLGHRLAASCAVWQVKTTAEVAQECAAAGQPPPTSDALYLHLENRAEGHKKRRIYRRLAANELVDEQADEQIKMAHPASWALLERQFSIRLQGEEDKAISRQGLLEEILAVDRYEAELGYRKPLIAQLLESRSKGRGQEDSLLKALRQRHQELYSDGSYNPFASVTENRPSKQPESDDKEASLRPKLRVSELMYRTLQNLLQGLRRHGDKAHIAFALTSPYAIYPGARRYYFDAAAEALDKQATLLSVDADSAARRKQHIDYLAKALSRWLSLFQDRRWQDKAAEQLWRHSFQQLPSVEDSEKQQKLERFADQLLAEPALRQRCADAFRTQWEAQDKAWQQRLRHYGDWIRGRYFWGATSEGDKHRRRIGGLSLQRLALLTEFRRRVQTAFYSRLKPDGEKAELPPSFGQKTLHALDKMRDQRVKQLSSRILEAALGLGRRPSKDGSQKRLTTAHDDVCPVVVIENLQHYRPDEMRTRRENRQLMTWSAARIRDLLQQGCELHGLRLYEVAANYSSRQDSRTGAPGMRANEISCRRFLLPDSRWQKKVADAQAKKAEKRNDEERLFCACQKWSEQHRDGKHSVLLPIQGGELFVSACDSKGASAALQADLNAAANIGLRAIIDPDWNGAWWYIPCDAAGRPNKEAVKGSPAIKAHVALRTSWQDDEQAQKGKKKTVKKDIRNLWRDPSAQAISAANGPWVGHQKYWAEVKEKVTKKLQEKVKLDKKVP